MIKSKTRTLRSSLKNFPGCQWMAAAGEIMFGSASCKRCFIGLFRSLRSLVKTWTSSFIYSRLYVHWLLAHVSKECHVVVVFCPFFFLLIERWAATIECFEKNKLFHCVPHGVHWVIWTHNSFIRLEINVYCFLNHSERCDVMTFSL